MVSRSSSTSTSASHHPLETKSSSWFSRRLPRSATSSKATLISLTSSSSHLCSCFLTPSSHWSTRASRTKDSSSSSKVNAKYSLKIQRPRKMCLWGHSKEETSLERYHFLPSIQEVPVCDQRTMPWLATSTTRNLTKWSSCSQKCVLSFKNISSLIKIASRFGKRNSSETSNSCTTSLKSFSTNWLLFWI